MIQNNHSETKDTWVKIIKEIFPRLLNLQIIKIDRSFFHRLTPWATTDDESLERFENIEQPQMEKYFQIKIDGQ